MRCAKCEKELHACQCPPPKKEWVGLTDEEIADVFGDYMDSMDETEEEEVHNWDYERLIEAKVKEKNSTSEKDIQTSDAAYKRGYMDAMGWKIQNPLENLPPIAKGWVGLTDEELEDIVQDGIKRVEAKLKEKNA
jgi:hypothetical protein